MTTPSHWLQLCCAAFFLLGSLTAQTARREHIPSVDSPFLFASMHEGSLRILEGKGTQTWATVAVDLPFPGQLDIASEEHLILVGKNRAEQGVIYLIAKMRDAGADRFAIVDSQVYPGKDFVSASASALPGLHIQASGDLFLVEANEREVWQGKVDYQRGKLPGEWLRILDASSSPALANPNAYFLGVSKQKGCLQFYFRVDDLNIEPEIEGDPDSKRPLEYQVIVPPGKKLVSIAFPDWFDSESKVMIPGRRRLGVLIPCPELERQLELRAWLRK